MKKKIVHIPVRFPHPQGSVSPLYNYPRERGRYHMDMKPLTGCAVRKVFHSADEPKERKAKRQKKRKSVLKGKLVNKW